MKPERFLIASGNSEEEGPKYILHTEFPKALIQIVHTANNADDEGKTYSYMLQNEVQPRYLKFTIVQHYEQDEDYSKVIDEAWHWLQASDVLAA